MNPTHQYPNNTVNATSRILKLYLMVDVLRFICRLQTGEVKYAGLEDGRKICLECLETAVFDTKECQPLYREVLKFYKNVGMMIDQEVPMLLVERTALNEAREGEKEVRFSH